MKLQDIDHIGILGTGLMGPSFIKFRTDPNDKTGYLIHEGFSPQKSIRKLRQIMKGGLK
jgi:hypothetical protein